MAQGSCCQTSIRRSSRHPQVPGLRAETGSCPFVRASIGRRLQTPTTTRTLNRRASICVIRNCRSRACPLTSRDRTHGSRFLLPNLDSPFVSAPSSSGASSRNGFLSLRPGQYRTTTSNPDFEQKGVDMRIGLDIATYANNRSVDRIILITGDTDCLPAMKLARTAGLQVVLVQFRQQRLARELLWHSDYQRSVAWPSQPENVRRPLVP